MPSSIALAQGIPSSCSLSDTIAARYKSDADRLAIRRVYHINSGYEDSIKVDRAISNNYLSALIAVFNATSIPARDTVIRLCNIHTKADPDMNKFFISADTSLTWLKNIRNNISPTGNIILDNAVSRYNLVKTQYNAWNFYYNDVYFHTDTNINSQPLGVAIYSMPGVVAAGPSDSPWDGPNIEDSLNSNFTFLIYSYAWGDCAVGCLYKRSWEFKIYTDCSVEYMGFIGPALPADVGIKENSMSENFKLYPNPVNDKLFLDINNNLSENLKVVISNTLGQTLYSSNNFPIKEGLDVNFLKSGIYYLDIRSLQGQKSFKIIKE